ncbi:MAG: TMEM43 family protein [Candidatus Magnetoovum sp. WYHC-5]|nr:TMEM43 family protein [Candidatus Magnetoovum sp. WYHC-5]
MSEDSYTEVSRQSWFGRLGGAFKGIVVGLIFIIASFVLLFWNEGRAVSTYKSLKEGASVVVSVGSAEVELKHEGKLIHLAGQANTNDVLSDQDFGISLNAIKLKRVVKMYQWEEKEESTTEKDLGGGTTTKKTYTYLKTWASTLIDSDKFKKTLGHENPKHMPYVSKELTATKVTVDAFTLSEGLISKLNDYKPFVLNPSDMTSIRNGRIVEGGIYVGRGEPNNPIIGDIKIDFQFIAPQPVSIIAKQFSGSFTPYLTSNGREIEIIKTGTHTAESLFTEAQKENKLLTWVLRIAGFFLMFIGFTMIFKPLSVVMDVIPFFGNIAETGAGIISFLISGIFSLITIAIAWVFYRPLLSVPMAAGAIGLLVFLIVKVRKNR